MKKLISLVLGFVLLSGAAYAGVYWLPDYLQDNMDRNARSSDDDSNRTDSCPSGTYSSPKDSSRWNCSASASAASSIHKVCYSCTAKACASGVIQSACNTANGYTWTANGYYSGNNPCGGCKANDCSAYKKKSECITSNGYTYTQKCKSAGVNYGTCVANNCSAYKKKSECITSNGYTYTQKCKSAGVDYGTCVANTCPGVKESSCNTDCYTFTSKGCKSAGANYGTCTAKSCPNGYTAGITSCSTGYTLSSSGCSGEKPCGKCTTNSCEGKTQKQCYDQTCGSNGWTWAAGSCNSAGTQYGTCTAKSCPSGYTSGLTSCTAKTGYTATYSKSTTCNGDKPCGRCDYKANVCSGVAQSSCSTTCYTFTSNGCNSAGTLYGRCTAKSCPSGYSTSYKSVSNCGTSGSSGWTFTTSGCSGSSTCGKCTKKSCPSGYSTSYKSVSNCGSTGTSGWTFATSGYSGNTVCGKCTKKSCQSGTTYANRNCGANQIWEANGYYSGDEKCGTCIDSCKLTSCQLTTIKAGFSMAFIPAVSLPGYCAAGSRLQSGNPHPDTNDNCGLTRCYACDADATYNAWNFSTNSGSPLESLYEQCLLSCTYSTTDVQTDLYVCYTMCNAAKMKKINTTSSSFLSEENKTFYCPYNLKSCCDSMEGTRNNNVNGKIINNVQFWGFKCDLAAAFPSCRPSCSSW